MAPSLSTRFGFFGLPFVSETCNEPYIGTTRKPPIPVFLAQSHWASTDGCSHGQPSTWSEDQHQVPLIDLSSDDTRTTFSSTRHQTRDLAESPWSVFGRSTRPGLVALWLSVAKVNSRSTRRIWTYPIVTKHYRTTPMLPNATKRYRSWPSDTRLLIYDFEGLERNHFRKWIGKPKKCWAKCVKFQEYFGK